MLQTHRKPHLDPDMKQIDKDKGRTEHLHKGVPSMTTIKACLLSQLSKWMNGQPISLHESVLRH